MRTIDLNLNVGEQKHVEKYKEKASKLFERLNSLQSNEEVQKSQKQRQILNEFTNVERKVFEGSKMKEGWYAKIISIVQGIQCQLADQRNEQQKCQRTVKSWIQSTERQINIAFERFQKERSKNQINLQKYIDNKIDFLILKNKNVWNSQSLIKKDLFIEQIQYLEKEHQRFLVDYKKEVDKLKKETAEALKEYRKIMQEELNNNDEDKIILFMKTVHQQINSKVTSLQQQRQKTQEKVLSVLEKIVNSCLNQSKQ